MIKFQITCKACGHTSESIEEIGKRTCESCKEKAKCWKEMEAIICRRGHNYILDEEGEPKEARSLAEWAAYMEWGRKKGGRIVKQEWVDNVRVSTVFLGLNHNWGEGPPVLWETMTFSNRADWDQLQDRCSGAREQAEAMHEQMLVQVREALAQKKK